MEKLSLEVATEFLLIAATLIELKTRRLLPGDDDLDLDEELALWSERDLLLTRLVECKTFKDAAVALHALSDRAGPLVPACRRAGRAVHRPHARRARGRHRERPAHRVPAGRRPQAGGPHRSRPRRADPRVGHRRRRRAARGAPARRHDHVPRAHRARWSSGSTSWCGSSPCSSCSSRASSTSTSPAPSATSASCGSGRDRSELEELSPVDAYDG